MRLATFLLMTLVCGCNRAPSGAGPVGPRETTSEAETTRNETNGSPEPEEPAGPETTAANGTMEPMPTTPQDESPSRVRVTAEEAAEHGFPAVGFSFDATGTPMHSGTFPSDGVLAYASGPPGGVQMIRVEGCDEAPEATGALERHVRARYSDERIGPLALGAPTEVELAGARRPALPFATGRSMARANYCAIAVANPAGGGPGLVVVAAHSDLQGEPDCRVPLANEQLARVLGTFRLE